MIFIGDDPTLNAMAEERDANGNYKYPELRTAFGLGNPNVNDNANSEDESDDKEEHQADSYEADVTREEYQDRVDQ